MCEVDKDPGRLVLVRNISKCERQQLSDLLDRLFMSNTFRVLESILEEDFLMFLDIFQGETLMLPTVEQVIRRLNHIRIYNDSKVMSLQSLAKKHKRSEETVSNILSRLEVEFSDEEYG